MYKEKSGLFSLSMGRVLTSGDERMLGRGIKQLDRALGLFEFVWETGGVLTFNFKDICGCLGAKERNITYRG